MIAASTHIHSCEGIRSAAPPARIVRAGSIRATAEVISALCNKARRSHLVSKAKRRLHDALSTPRSWAMTPQGRVPISTRAQNCYGHTHVITPAFWVQPQRTPLFYMLLQHARVLGQPPDTHLHMCAVRRVQPGRHPCPICTKVYCEAASHEAYNEAKPYVFARARVFASIHGEVVPTTRLGLCVRGENKALQLHAHRRHVKHRS